MNLRDLLAEIEALRERVRTLENRPRNLPGYITPTETGVETQDSGEQVQAATTFINFTGGTRAEANGDGTDAALVDGDTDYQVLSWTNAAGWDIDWIRAHA